MKTSLLMKCLLSATVLYAAGTGIAAAHDFDRGWRNYPPPHHVVRNYNYVYYPSHQVYYSPDHRAWYWTNGRGWETGSRLPYFVNVGTRLGGVPIVLRSATPYVEHVYVEQTYGRPWRDRHGWHQERRYEREWREERRDHHHHWR